MIGRRLRPWMAAAPWMATPWVAGTFLIAVYLLVLGAPFFAPYPAAHQERALPYAPPMGVHFQHPEKGWRLRPFIFPSRPVEGSFDVYEEDTERPTELLFWQRDGSGQLRLVTADSGVHLHLLGTDGFGRDLFSRLLYAGRISLLSGLAAALLSLVLGTVLGSLAGFFGGWVDALIMRGCELLTALPWLYMLLAVRAFLPLDVAPALALALTLGLIALLGWAQPARLVRAAVASLRQREFVLAAEGFGASPAAVLWHHILPHLSGLLAVQFCLALPRYILAEVTLSFLGLGMAEPYASWGTLLADAASYQRVQAYSWLMWPAWVLILVILSYHRLADFPGRRRGSVAL